MPVALGSIESGVGACLRRSPERTESPRSVADQPALTRRSFYRSTFPEIGEQRRIRAWPKGAPRSRASRPPRPAEVELRRTIPLFPCARSRRRSRARRSVRGSARHRLRRRRGLDPVRVDQEAGRRRRAGRWATSGSSSRASDYCSRLRLGILFEQIGSCDYRPGPASEYRISASGPRCRSICSQAAPLGGGKVVRACHSRVLFGQSAVIVPGRLDRSSKPRRERRGDGHPLLRRDDLQRRVNDHESQNIRGAGARSVVAQRRRGGEGRRSGRGVSWGGALALAETRPAFPQGASARGPMNWGRGDGAGLAVARPPTGYEPFYRHHAPALVPRPNLARGG